MIRVITVVIFTLFSTLSGIRVEVGYTMKRNLIAHQSKVAVCLYRQTSGEDMKEMKFNYRIQ